MILYIYKIQAILCMITLKLIVNLKIVNFAMHYFLLLKLHECNISPPCGFLEDLGANISSEKKIYNISDLTYQKIY